MPKLPPLARSALITLARVAFIAAVYTATTLPPPWHQSSSSAQASTWLSAAFTTTSR